MDDHYLHHRRVFPVLISVIVTLRHFSTFFIPPHGRTRRRSCSIGTLISQGAGGSTLLLDYGTNGASRRRLLHKLL